MSRSELADLEPFLSHNIVPHWRLWNRVQCPHHQLDIQCRLKVDTHIYIQACLLHYGHLKPAILGRPSIIRLHSSPPHHSLARGKTCDRSKLIGFASVGISDGILIWRRHLGFSTLTWEIKYHASLLGNQFRHTWPQSDRSDDWSHWRSTCIKLKD